MVDEPSQSDASSKKQIPLKEYWEGLQSNISAASKRVSDSTKKAANVASEWGSSKSQQLKSELQRRSIEKEVRRKEQVEDLRESLSKEILPVTEHIPPQVSISVEEYEVDG